MDEYILELWSVQSQFFKKDNNVLRLNVLSKYGSTTTGQFYPNYSHHSLHRLLILVIYDISNQNLKSNEYVIAASGA